MSAIPTQAELLAALGGHFSFTSPTGETATACLADVPDGIAMDDNHVCYAARFELPAGTHLPQELYRITSPGGASWNLLATPNRPTAEGLGVMTAVIHTRKAADPA